MSVATRTIPGWERWQIMADYQETLRNRIHAADPDGWCFNCGAQIIGRSALAKFCTPACKRNYWRPCVSTRGKKRVAA